MKAPTPEADWTAIITFISIWVIYGIGLWLVDRSEGGSLEDSPIAIMWPFLLPLVLWWYWLDFWDWMWS